MEGSSFFESFWHSSSLEATEIMERLLTVEQLFEKLADANGKLEHAKLQEYKQDVIKVGFAHS
jgi:hypothetical protein